ncbi:lysozyme [Rhizobium leguminosarum]|uniref:lysozyme n=2 Tax=Rhizobium/Agrobacterium group TaxID=227290 RepID=UPI003D6E2F16
MRTSAAGRKAIAQREGNKLIAYLDGVGLWIGVGHTTAAGPPAVKKGLKITAAESDQIVTRDLGDVEATINKAVKVPLNAGLQHRWNSFCKVHAAQEVECAWLPRRQWSGPSGQARTAVAPSSQRGCSMQFSARRTRRPKRELLRRHLPACSCFLAGDI